MNLHIPRKPLATLFAVAAAVCTVSFLSATTALADAAIKSGQSIAFLGDSITQQGAGSASGYVRLVISGLEANGIKATAIPAGISGHTSRDMIKRLEKDVLSKKPDFMTLSCGVNDVWHGATGVVLEEYKKNITAIVDQAQAAGITVVILTSTMIHENQSEAFNQQLVAYNDFLKALAKEKKCLLADLNADMQSALAAAKASGRKPANGGNYLTADGVHMNADGNQMMAAGVLTGFGLSEGQRTKAHETWLDIPGAVQVGGKVGVTLRQLTKLEAAAAKQNTSVDSLLTSELNKAVEALLK